MKNRINLKISTQKLKNFILLEIKGEINIFSSPLVRDRLVGYYKGNKGIIVDLSDVSVMDSSGVATLVEGLAWSKHKQKEFILVGLGLSVYNILSLAKLEHIFNIKPGLNASLNQTTSFL